jgi:hypothetical protein
LAPVVVPAAGAWREAIFAYVLVEVAIGGGDAIGGAAEVTGFTQRGQRLAGVAAAVARESVCEVAQVALGGRGVDVSKKGGAATSQSAHAGGAALHAAQYQLALLNEDVIHDRLHASDLPLG